MVGGYSHGMHTAHTQGKDGTCGNTYAGASLSRYIRTCFVGGRANPDFKIACQAVSEALLRAVFLP